MPTTPSPPPLPRTQGPKLEPFRGTASADVELISFLGSKEDVDSKVWKVRIDKNIYALKIFGFQNWRFLKTTEGACIMPPDMDPLHRPDLTPQQYIDYLDPFNCECRAYGRLKQEKCEDIAVRTHGYILLTREQERVVTEALGEDYVDWENHPGHLDCDGVFPRWEEHRHERLRAIVKDYVSVGNGRPWTASQIQQMYTDLERLHELGILVRDIHEGNYLDGKLVDFSMAWTMYHPCLERSTPSGILRSRLEDPSKFEDMIDQWALDEGKDIEELKPNALVKWRYRPGNDTGSPGRREEDAGVDPRLYNWKKWMDGGGEARQRQ